jgi:uncharacterized protein (TIGR03067 family)
VNLDRPGAAASARPSNQGADMSARLWSGGSVLALLLTTGWAPAGGEREEQLRMQGSWRTAFHGPSEQPVQQHQEIITVAGGRLTFGKDYAYTLRLAPTREPRELDLIGLPDSPQTKGRSYKGIYKLEGDTFVVHYALSGDRPKSFTDAGPNVWVLRLQRVREPRKE